MAIENLYNSLSKYSIASILYRFMFDIEPTRVWIANETYQIQPLGIKSGVVFYHHICSNMFENIWIDYFNSSNTSILKYSFSNHAMVDALFRLIDDIYNFDSTKSLYDLLWNSSLKQIKYLLYVIKKQNFTYYDSNLKYDSYSNVFDTLGRMDKILEDFIVAKKNRKKVHSLIDVDAVEYADVNISETLKVDYTTQFYKDYIIGNEGFYSLVLNSYIMKFINLLDDIPQWVANDDPVYWCKINNDKCMSGCKYFDAKCIKRYIKNYSYLPFKSVFVLPQILSLSRSSNRENEIDNLVRAVLYSLSVSFGERSDPTIYYNVDHNNTIAPLMDKNRFTMIKSLFGGFDFEQVEDQIRNNIGLKENKSDTYENAYSILFKIYKFVETNAQNFVPDGTRMEIFYDFLNNHVKKFIIEKVYEPIGINVATDFTAYIQSQIDGIISLDNMLMKFPNDMKNMDRVADETMKAIQSTKKNLTKMGGGRAIIDPRETLLTSDNALFRRIAVSRDFWQFYRTNNKTKLINSVLFWKWSLAYSFLAGNILQLPDEHAIQKMDFNESE